jgi:WD40 repeat protein
MRKSRHSQFLQFAAFSALLFAGAPSAFAQVNEFNTVVFGNKIPLYLDDPTGGMPVRNTTNDHSAMVPYIAGSKVLLMSPSGKNFVTVSGDTASLWRADTGSQLLALQHGSAITWMSYARDGSFIVTGGNSWLRVWSATGEFRKQCDLQSQLLKLIVSLDGRYLIAVTTDSIQIWSSIEGLLLTKIPLSNRIASLVISPDSSQIAVLDGSNCALWRISDGQMIGTIAHEYPIRACMYSPDGSTLLVATEQWTYLWDPRKFKKIADVQYGGGYR